MKRGSVRAVKIIERTGSPRCLSIAFRTSCAPTWRSISRRRAGRTRSPGVPKEIYSLWQRHFRDRGYKLRVQIIDFPGGMPGDVGMTLSWS